MILVLASAVDRIAAEFVRQAGGGAKLLTCRDLSVPGWRLMAPAGEPAVAVAEGERIPARKISAVIIRLPYVNEAELPQIAAADRSYVASEAQAFLYAFLISLKCPVINRPTPVCLAGPNWRRPQWMRAAREVGLALGDSAGAKAAQQAWAVSVIGGQCFGASDPVVKQAACGLAGSAGVQMLRVWFAGDENAPVFLGADLWPDLSEPEIGAAVMSLAVAEVPA